MPQIGWFEILIIVFIAIILIGPKDFPYVLKKIGSYIGSIKRYVSNIQQEVTELTEDDIEIKTKESNSKKEAKKDTFTYVKKVSCRAVNINLRCDPSSFTAWAYGSTKKP